MHTTINRNDQSHMASGSLLALLHISSPALPVGAFAYSQALEFALDCGWCKNKEEVQAWIQQNLVSGLGKLDLPVYQRCYEAWQRESIEELIDWNDILLAFRESKELYLEDIQVGSAYAQWHLGQDPAREPMIDQCKKPSVVAMSSLAAVLSRIDVFSAMLGFAWGWLENQIACASKAMPMGQTDGQKILQELIPVVSQVCTEALTIKDDEIGTGLMGLAMASSWHEHQYSRLFRS